LRVGGSQARITDEKLGLRHGIVGQETTGVGGFACALRTIPPVLNVAHEMEASAPDGYLINFTNPSGIITEALIRHSSIRSVGLCNIPICTIMDCVKFLDCAMEDVLLDYVGLNHLAWVRGFSVAGNDVTDEAFAAFYEAAGEEWDEPAVLENMKLVMKSLGMLPNPYLQYFYATRDKLESMKAKPKTRGEEVVEIENALLKKYQDESLQEKPPELSQRGGAHYSTAAFHLIDAIENDRRNKQIVCCRNAGAVPTFDDDASVELTATIGKDGATALPQQAPEPEIRGLMQSIKAYESLTVEAAVTGDRNAAFQAMLEHPLMPGAAESERLLDELLEINRPYVNPALFN
jgi:6-phospho-beta-glucosidase